MRFPTPFLLAVFGTALLAGCSGVYYDAMEKVGIPKRKILVDRVEAARASQQEAKQQFADALTHFLAVTKVSAGELQPTYEKLQADFHRSEARAKEVRERIQAIDSVATAEPAGSRTVDEVVREAFRLLLGQRLGLGDMAEEGALELVDAGSGRGRDGIDGDDPLVLDSELRRLRQEIDLVQHDHLRQLVEPGAVRLELVLDRRPTLGRVAVGRVNDVAGLIAHPHLRRITVETPGGPVSYPAPAPIRDEARSYGAIPKLGEHTEKVRREFG